MNKVAIAFSTKDRVELTKQSIKSLLQPDKFDLWWIDGSTTPEGENLPSKYPSYIHVHGNVRGGADSAIVYGLTTLLNAEQNYEVVALCENDVLLPPDFFDSTMALFERGRAEGLEVGAVSPRCYEDRILLQRDGFAVVHNTGAGVIFLTRKAAEIVLANFRTGQWNENRRTFMALSGIDIGRYAAFRANDQAITADWHFDNVLAQCGYASLALTPAECTMIGQIPPLHEQGLKLVAEPVDLLRNDKAFTAFADRTRAIREQNLELSFNQTQFQQASDGTWTIFPHQIADIGGRFYGPWRLKWSQGFGPFAWKAGDINHREFVDGVSNCEPWAVIPVSSPCSFLVSGGQNGGQVCVEDLASGYKVTPVLPPEGQATQILNLPVPGGVTYREIRLTMLTPGTVFYGITTRESQPWLPQCNFDHSRLPPV